MKIVCISDTHNQHARIQVPMGDVLIHAGDATVLGTLNQVEDFAKWFDSQPHKYKLYTPGNHDFALEFYRKEALKFFKKSKVLIDEEITIEGKRIYMSPWTPEFYDWAFMKSLDRIQLVWDNIPSGLDVLVTHGPPKGILDITTKGQNVGCPSLRDTILKVRPKNHVFGHIHESYGLVSEGETNYWNVASCNRGYEPVNMPITFDI